MSLNAERLRRLVARALKATLATPLVIAGCHGERPVKPDVPAGLLATNYRRIRCVDAPPREESSFSNAVPGIDRAWMVPEAVLVHLGARRRHVTASAAQWRAASPRRAEANPRLPARLHRGK
ncbi:hypothetical protein D7Y21_23750 [Corallococcus sp. AB045]|nr:hypothetical protein D7Y21_23750 [Corallococcus sp. AB045]